ncbi:MAG: family 43 glycosylhydrolase, partial [Firmicutes bacterium]|nr:family 43 glycosylhydrolase [Bacillota bacterium]
MAEEFYTNNFELEEQWSDYGIGDPYVLRYNGRYYLYPSTKDGFPGVRVWVSEDLVNWSYAGYATEEPVTTTAYAPEVVYSNGKFYMYTSPAGNGHYVLTSNSPLGPFELQTDNFGMTIDGSVFIDDDGQWYFTHAGTQGIIGHAMHDPLNVSPAGRTLNAYLGHWTEGSTIFKREGTYYMTYTGNHVFSPGYRINYSFATDEPLGSYITPRNNPIIINTTDNFFGLGHNSIVLGPNLDAYYIVYHNLVGRSMAGPPVRKMNIDRMAFNGKKLVVLGPTYFPQPVPELPDYFTWIDEEGWNEWLIYERDQQILALSPA